LRIISKTTKAEETETKHKQVKVLVETEIANAFKAACMKAGVSMACELSRFMSDYGKVTKKCKSAVVDVTTRRNRRKQINTIIKQMERIRDAETRYYDNFPENLRMSAPYEATEEAISIIDEVIDSLGSIYGIVAHLSSRS